MGLLLFHRRYLFQCMRYSTQRYTLLLFMRQLVASQNSPAWVCQTMHGIEMLEDASFEGMVHSIRPSARIPEKKDCVTTMRTVKTAMMEKV